MQLTPPQISKLFGRERKWGWRRVRAGTFGKARPGGGVNGRAWTVSLEAVEAYAGRKFSPEQIEAAVNSNG